jgi:murein DD-endopeptidase MepM/ murein hydrolase activator NlpD
MMAVVSQRSRRSRWTLGFLFILLIIFAAVGGVSYLGWRQSAGRVRAAIAPPPRFLGQKTPLTVAVEAARGNVARVEVRLLQGGTNAVVAKQDGSLGRRVEIPFSIEAAPLGLKDGSAALEVSARDDYWRPLRFDNKPILSLPLTVDLTPPSIEMLSATQYLYQGGGGLVAFRLKGAESGQVRVGTLGFPSYAVGDGGARIALFALPWDFPPATPITITARDEAGNTTSRGIPSEVRPRRFPRDTIDLKDGFLQTKVPELLPQHPQDTPLLDGFLTINRDQRRQAEEEKRRLAGQTADKPLWEGAFLQPPNTKVFSNFAETRVYLYRGKEVDTQVHLGYDLASLKQSPVPAANAGTVVHAGPLTIYGSTVVVDHGLGLQTLYGHLSRVDVKPGDSVKRGQELGRSGMTGLAIGDHLHFEVLISGISVTPVEWWDAKWLRDRIGKPLKDAGLPAIAGAEYKADRGGGDRSDGPAAAPRPQKAARRR